MAIELIAGSLVSGPAGVSGGFPSPTFDSTDATLIIAGAVSYTGSTPNPDVVDSLGNTWTAVGTAYGFNIRARLFYTVPTTTGASHTVTMDGFGIYGTISVVAFKNTHASPDGSDAVPNANFGTSASAGSYTPTAANRVVVSVVGHDGPTTSAADVNSGGFTTVSTAYANGVNMGAGLGYQIQTTATAFDPIWGWGGESVEWTMQSATFKSIGESGGGAKPLHYYQQMRQRQQTRTRSLIYVPRQGE